MKSTHPRQNACELKNNHNRDLRTRLLQSALVAALALASPGGARAQEPSRPAPSTEHQAPAAGAEHAAASSQPEHPAGQAGEAHAAEEHGIFSGLLWPLVNFVILFGGLWWFFKEPLSNYLRDRHSSIRKDLVEAAQVKNEAAAQLAELDKKLEALPGEIEMLRRRGAEEIAAEEQRIAAQAAAERDRLLEQTRREIEVQVRLAKRALVEHAADLSVQLASERLQQQMTPDDQGRLVDRYLENVKNPPA
jgi:F-type H+-transporting ATPase subunit b